VGPGAGRALRPGRRGQVEIAHARGAYLRLGRYDYVHLCRPWGPRGPLSVVLSQLPALAPRWWVRVEARALQVGPLALPLSGAERAAAAPAAAWASDGAVARAMAAARRELPAPPPPVVAGLALLAAGDVPAAVAALAGRGDGLTPAGDDVLVGFAGWRAIAGTPIALGDETRGRCSPIGLAYLRCAERGELPDAADALLRAIAAGDAAVAARRARVLARWGASSGPALYWGMQAAWIDAATGETRPGRASSPASRAAAARAS